MTIRSLNMTATGEQSPFNAEFDQLVTDTLGTWKIPGLSIAIVHGAHTHSKAYGLAEFPNKNMTTDALFPAASTTKAFTSAATSMVIKDSKYTESPIDWDTPISSLIPDDFALADDYLTAHTTLEDALSHRTGQPGHNWMLSYTPEDATPQDLYTNNMFIAVTHALHEITGIPLGRILKQRIWEPLNMNETFFGVPEAQSNPSAAGRIAEGYTWSPDSEGGFYSKESQPSWRANTGAGAIVSSVLDYSKWIREQIEKSGPLKDHDSLIKPRTFHFEEGDLNLPSPYHAYALGWFVDNYRGQNLYHHTGSWPGYGSFVGFIPDKQFGFVMMGNSATARNGTLKLVIHLIDKLLGPSTDPLLNERMTACFKRQMEEREQMMEDLQRSTEDVKKRLFLRLPDPPIPHSLDLEKYAGTYKHPANASVTIKFEDGKLFTEKTQGALPSVLDLTHASGNFFVGRTKTFNLALMVPFIVEFWIDSTGSVRKVGMDVEPSLKGEMIWFERCEV
ncbi:Peptidase S12 Pab87-related C-terminal [Penicillium atrosanguineum]|uniref:Peptidase S12 Pab87-related C-terminal n=1 Tax=Penicillium atrosanguineum TaxID=1132637 RepID=A0A9W9PNU6_9EURO|nr:Peptidase S12 Pab87-related C-terminal [Penicillium atrosanguineum]